MLETGDYRRTRRSAAGASFSLPCREPSPHSCRNAGGTGRWQPLQISRKRPSAVVQYRSPSWREISRREAFPSDRPPSVYFGKYRITIGLHRIHGHLMTATARRFSDRHSLRCVHRPYARHHRPRRWQKGDIAQATPPPTANRWFTLARRSRASDLTRGSVPLLCTGGQCVQQDSA